MLYSFLELPQESRINFPIKGGFIPMKNSGSKKLNWLWLRNFAIFSILLFSSIWRLGEVPYHQDESAWIFMSRNYEAFVQFNFRDPLWKESFWTLTQPPLAGYLIGIGRNLGGISADQVCQPYDFFISADENIARGAIPNPNLLWWARFPMAILTSISFMILFLMIEKGFGATAGWVYLFLTLGNKYLYYCLRLALGEASLLFFLCFAMAFASLAYQSWQNKAIPEQQRIIHILIHFLIMSVFIGFSTASKLNGGFAVIAAIILSQSIGLSEIKGIYRTWFLWKFPILIGSVSFFTFFIINPFLYSSPIINSLKLLMFRNLEIGIQESTFSEHQISGIAQQLQIDFQRIFQDYATFNFPGAWIINLMFFCAGFFILLRNFKQYKSRSTPWIFVLFGGIVSFPSLFTPLDYPRYFLFPVIFTLLLSSVGMAYISIILWSIWKKRPSKGYS